MLFSGSGHSFITFNLFDNSGLTFSKSGVSFNKAPDSYEDGGFDQLPRYILDLIKPSKNYKRLIISTQKGDKTFSLGSKEGLVNVSFSLTKSDVNMQKLSKIRNYFTTLNIKPLKDYLAKNGGVKDAIRVLTYPIQGNEKEVTKRVEEMLLELVGISDKDAVEIYYKEY